MAKNFNELDPIIHVKGNASKSLIVSAEFYANKKEDELPFRESNLSRLDASLISKTDGKTDVLVFNIPSREINEVKLKTDIAINYLMTSSAINQQPDEDGFGSSLAFTTPLMLSAFKGKTPAAVLMENPANKEVLIKGKAWLEANLDKYPANKKQIDAIDDAINLLNIGELSGSAPVSQPNNVLTIYKRDYKHKSKKDENGNNLIYSIEIICDTTKNMPFAVNVMNCYAPVEKVNGQTVVRMNSAVNTKKVSMLLTDSEWISLVGQAYDLYQNFKRIHSLAAFKRVAENSTYSND